MLSVTQKGDYSKTTGFLKNMRHADRRVASVLSKYGRKGVDALNAATSVDTGKTAQSWYYKIESKNETTKLSFCNSNIQNGVPIAIILQYGHGTGTGGWVEGRDYINPALQPIFDEIANEAWEEVTKP